MSNFVKRKQQEKQRAGTATLASRDVKNRGLAPRRQKASVAMPVACWNKEITYFETRLTKTYPICLSSTLDYQQHIMRHEKGLWRGEKKEKTTLVIKIQNFSAIFLQLLFSSFTFLLSSFYGLFVLIFCNISLVLSFDWGLVWSLNLDSYWNFLDFNKSPLSLGIIMFLCTSLFILLLTCRIGCTTMKTC